MLALHDKCMKNTPGDMERGFKIWNAIEDGRDTEAPMGDSPEPLGRKAQEYASRDATLKMKELRRGASLLKTRMSEYSARDGDGDEGPLMKKWAEIVVRGPTFDTTMSDGATSRNNLLHRLVHGLQHYKPERGHYFDGLRCRTMIGHCYSVWLDEMCDYCASHGIVVTPPTKGWVSRYHETGFDVKAVIEAFPKDEDIDRWQATPLIQLFFMTSRSLDYDPDGFDPGWLFTWMKLAHLFLSLQIRNEVCLKVEEELRIAREKKKEAQRQATEDKERATEKLKQEKRLAYISTSAEKKARAKKAAQAKRDAEVKHINEEAAKKKKEAADELEILLQLIAEQQEEIRKRVVEDSKKGKSKKGKKKWRKK